MCHISYFYFYLYFFPSYRVWKICSLLLRSWPALATYFLNAVDSLPMWQPQLRIYLHDTYDMISDMWYDMIWYDIWYMLWYLFTGRQCPEALVEMSNSFTRYTKYSTVLYDFFFLMNNGWKEMRNVISFIHMENWKMISINAHVGNNLDNIILWSWKLRCTNAQISWNTSWFD